MYRIPTFIFLFFFVSLISSAQTMKCIRAKSLTADLYDQRGPHKGAWTISPSARPDVYDVLVVHDSEFAGIKTDLDSLTFYLKTGDNFDFVVLLENGDSAFTRFTGQRGPAVFTTEYMKEYDGKTIVEIPAAYELVNIVIALTDIELHDSEQVDKRSQYYKEMYNWFSLYKNEPAVLIFDSLIKKSMWNYFYLKMNAYSYVFEKGKLIPSKIYNRSAWDFTNSITPYVKELEQFAVESNFQKFYDAHQRFYNEQIQYERDSLDIPGMQSWLMKNFPSTSYNCLKVIFSPLVGSSQSVTKAEYNDFKEVHVHVNFPYPDSDDKLYSLETVKLRNGSILFTEYNHAFINPEAEKYSSDEKFNNAFKDLTFWETPNSSAVFGYTSPLACFEEYMNWSLVCLRYEDLAPEMEKERLISGVEKMMDSGRGFPIFKEFNRELLRLYKSRKDGETVADLYPGIIEWCYKKVLEKK